MIEYQWTERVIDNYNNNNNNSVPAVMVGPLEHGPVSGQTLIIMNGKNCMSNVLIRIIVWIW